MAAQFSLNPQILKSVPLFSLFSDSQLTQVLTGVQHRSFPRNAFIVRAGEETDALYIILSGRVKVLIPDEEGHEVILSVLGPHDFFGEMGLLDDQVRSASVETLEPCEMKHTPFTPSSGQVSRLRVTKPVLRSTSRLKRGSA